MQPAWARAFLDWLARQELPLDLGQVRIDRPDRWRLRHADDDLPGLAPTADLFARCRTNDAGDYRPLPTSHDLPRGWVADGLDDVALIEALEAVYPAALAAWHAARTGRLRVVPWREVQRRQTGQHGLVKRLDDADAERAAAVLCEHGCVRQRLWRLEDTLPPEPLAGRPIIPCYEACSLFVSFARQVIGLRRGEREADEPLLRAMLSEGEPT